MPRIPAFASGAAQPLAGTGALVLAALFLRHGDAAGASEALAGKSGAFFSENGSEPWAVGYAPVPLAGWAVIVRESLADAVGPMARFSVLSPLLVILAALVSLVAVYLILTQVIRPLRTLGATVELEKSELARRS